MSDQKYKLTEAALCRLNEMPFDPNATHAYDHMAGGLVWSDEFPSEDASWDFVSNITPCRYLVRFRALITLGQTELSDQPLWRQVEQSAPNWPGLRIERRNGRIRRRLQAAKRLATRCYKELFGESEAVADASGEKP